jgi:hypothetical protein
MTLGLEDRVRETLRQQALEVEVRRPSPEGVFQRVRERRLRRRTTRTIVAVVAVAVIGFGALSRGSGTTVQTGHADQPAAAVLGHPAMIKLDGWTVSYVAVVDGFSEYQFASGSRSLQVSFYEQGLRSGNSTNPTEVPLRGTTGITTDEGAPRYRVDWDEQGRTWEADGAPFADVAEFLATLEDLRVVDQATWKAFLPDGVGASILANSDRGVTWDAAKGLSCFPAPPRDTSATTTPVSTPCN